MKYEAGFDIISLELDNEHPKEEIEKVKYRIVPSAQVDYNIITNEKVDELYWKNTLQNVKKNQVYNEIISKFEIK